MEEALVSLLLGSTSITDIIVDRIYPLEREQGDALPALTYQRISGARDHAYDGPTGLVENRFQIEAWAKTEHGAGSGYARAKGLIRAVRVVLAGYRGTVGPTRVHGIFIDDERDFRADGLSGVEQVSRVQLDIKAWHTE